MIKIYCIIPFFALAAGVATSQSLLNYNGHIVFDGQENPTGTSVWSISANHDGTVSSLVSESIVDTVSRDISLTDISESELWIPMDTGLGPTMSYRFRLHDPQTLETTYYLKLRARRMQDNPSGNNTALNLQSYATISKSENLSVVQLNMTGSSVAEVNDNLLFSADVWPREKNLLLALDEEMNIVYTREILHKGLGNFSSSWSKSALGQVDSNKRMQNDAFISDYTYSDSIEVILNGDTTVSFCSESCIFLGATTPTTEWYGSILDDYSGYLRLSESVIYENHAYRTFVISGDANLSAGDTPYIYSTNDGVYHGLLVGYDNDGNVEWAQKICQFEPTASELIPNITLNGELSAGNIMVLSQVLTPPNNGNSTGQLTFYANNSQIDMGSMSDSNPFLSNRSPLYLHSFSLDDGNCNSVIRIRSQPESAGYSYFAHQQMFFSMLSHESVSVNAAAGYSPFETGFIADRIFPNNENLLFTVPSAGAMPARMMHCDPTGLSAPDIYSLPVTNNVPGSVLQYISYMKPDGEILLSGQLTNQVEFEFANQTVPISTGLISNSYTASVIFASPTSTSADADRERMEIRLFPNPVGYQLSVSLNEPCRSFTIRDVSGRVVIQGDSDFGAQRAPIRSSGPYKIQIDVSSLSTGLYYISFQHFGASDQITEKFIKL